MTTKTTKANVYRADLYGLREGKYTYLWENDVSTTRWEEVAPQTPFYLFAKQDAGLLEEYEQGWKVTDIMPVNVLGFQTHRDKFAIDFEKSELEKRIQRLRDDSESIESLRQDFKLGKWDIQEARKELQKVKKWDAAFLECFYRPFDKRWCYYSDIVMDRPRKELLDHVAHQENLCLNVVRQTKMENWQHAVVTDTPAPAVFVEIKDGSSIFPLYLYPDSESTTLFDQPTPNPGGRRPNLSPAFLEDVSKRLGLTFVDDGKGDLETTFGPEDVFHYVYAVFHSPTYRERYAEFLKIDFPRVPLSSSPELFRALVAKGETLTALHLMERVGSVMTSYPVEGDNVVDKVSFKEDEGGKTGRVYINSTQYVDGVPTQVWNFYVGGYQVLHKWLKDRKGRTLSFDDLRHYRFIVSALFETIGTMREVDEAVEGAGGWPLE